MLMSISQCLQCPEDIRDIISKKPLSIDASREHRRVSLHCDKDGLETARSSDPSSLLQSHNDLVKPVFEDHQLQEVKTTNE